MDQIHKDILLQMRKNIVADLDVHNGIIHTLTTEFVLTEEDVIKINNGATKERRAIILLDILPSCGPYAFEVFLQTLRHHYSWLSDDIDKVLSSTKFDTTDMGRRSPGSPSLPHQLPATVIREEKMNQLKEALQKLLPGGYIALHGMKGFGKSSLTASTLKDKALVKKFFTNKVYWIKFGYERAIDDEILIQLNYLYHQVRNSETPNTPLNLEPLKEHLVHYLRHHFGKENNRNALLILDDVWNKDIIDVFDFHCKTLVITTDIDFLDGKQRKIIEMKNGFTEAESLGLFAQVLDTNVSKLPPEAKGIHDECNGMPILIAMFAAQFEEFKQDMNINTDRWTYYLNSLRSKDSTNKVIEKFLSKQEAIFDMCINRLKPDEKQRYEALAIFSEDVNIMPKTLEILWDGEPYRVEDQMLELCHKSLAAKQWNADLKSYVYGVHDLLLCHLRRKITPSKLTALHRTFIEKYRKYCNGDFSKLPEDNYSYSYIGHHLEQAELYDEFLKLYLDFDFIREKIYHTGISDLLIDLKKYRKYITAEKPENEAKVVHLEKFLESQAGVIAEHRRRECLDLVQIGLNHSVMGYVQQKAHELALTNSSKLYVIHDKQFIIDNLSICEEVSTEVCTAFFTDDPEKILIGNYSGEIILWDCETRRQTVFSGHNKKTTIIKIVVAISGDFFLALNDGGLIKLFILREDDLGFGTHRKTHRIQSPREKQSFWSGIFSNGDSKDHSHATFSIDGDTICDMTLCENDQRIATCTNNGIIKVWSVQGEILYTSNIEKHCFERIAFTKGLLHLMDRQGILVTYSENVGSSTSYNYISKYNPKIQQEKIIFFQAVPKNEESLMVVTELAAVYIKWFEVKDSKNPNMVANIYSPDKQRRAWVDNEKTRFTCAALTYDGQYLVIGDTEGFVNVWDANAGCSIATYRGRVGSLDTYWMMEDRYHMICGSGNRVLRRWKLPLQELPKSVRKPLFDAIMKPWGKADIIAKETPENAIVLYHGSTMMARTDPAEGSILRLSLNSDGSKIVYATDRGVMLFDVETKESTKILKPSSSPSFLKFFTVDRSTLVVCGENDDIRVWQDMKIARLAGLVENTGHVISLHSIDKKYAVTVARNGMIKFWRVRGTSWVCLNVLISASESENLCYSALNPMETLLAILKTNGELLLYNITKDTSCDPPQIETHLIVKNMFNQKLSCCAYSQDGNYLAIGLENGDISLFDIYGQNEIRRLELHCNEVRQLVWSPVSSGCQILLSVNCDELAWWNIAAFFDQRKESRPSRMGMSRSSSSPGFSPRSSTRMSVSQSLDSSMSNAIADKLQNLPLQPTNGDSTHENGSDNHDNINNSVNYWKNKTAKHSNRIALLSVVPLPPSCNAKVCVSPDFSKFLSVDIHGSVSNFKLHNSN